VMQTRQAAVGLALVLAGCWSKDDRAVVALRERIATLEAERQRGHRLECMGHCDVRASDFCASQMQYGGAVGAKEILGDHGERHVVFDCAVDQREVERAAEEQRDEERRAPFEAQTDGDATRFCGGRRSGREVAFVVKDSDSRYRCVFGGTEAEDPILEKCHPDQSPASCQEKVMAECRAIRERLSGQFSQLSPARYPTSRQPRASVHEVNDPVRDKTVGHYATADCGLEDDEEFQERRRMPRGANCNDYPACRYRNEQRREAAIWADVERMRERSRRRSSASAGAASSTPASTGRKKEFAEGLYVVRPECVTRPDSVACTEVSTVCIERRGGRYVGTVARRSQVLVRNKVKEHLKIFDIDQSTLSGSITIVLPFENTSCSSVAYQDASATGALSNDNAELSISYGDLKRDTGSCKVMSLGTSRTNHYYKASVGDEQCRSAIPSGLPPGAPIEAPILIGPGTL